jgi:hypothetical protein
MLAAAVTSALLSPQPAGAAGPPPLTGFMCGWSAMANPFSAGRTIGYLSGGPYVIADGADLRTGRVTCSIQSGIRHADPDLASATSITAAGVVTLLPTQFEYIPANFGRESTCTSVEIDGAGTFYWDGEAEEWSASPLAYCDIPGYGEEDLLSKLLDDANEFFVDEVDPVVCPLLADRAPGAGPVVVEPEGDVSLPEWDPVWDCPPYDGGTP